MTPEEWASCTDPIRMLDFLRESGLGRDFEDYIDRLSRLGCVGAEDWQWAPFVEDAYSGLLPDGPAAIRWRDWLGLPSAAGDSC
jgi:hypothetical protein